MKRKNDTKKRARGKKNSFRLCVTFSPEPPTIHEMNPAMFIRGKTNKLPEPLDRIAYDRRKPFVMYRLNQKYILKKIEEEDFDSFVRIRRARYEKRVKKQERIGKYRKEQIENYHAAEHHLQRRFDVSPELYLNAAELWDAHDTKIKLRTY